LPPALKLKKARDFDIKVRGKGLIDSYYILLFKRLPTHFSSAVVAPGPWGVNKKVRAFSNLKCKQARRNRFPFLYAAGFLLTKQAEGSDSLPRCSAVLKLLRSFLRRLNPIFKIKCQVQ